MQKQIASYLFQNKSCPLPGLGTLSVFITGAESDFTNKMIVPPTPVIRFVTNETDANGLLDYLSATTGASKYEVTEALDHFCDTIKKVLTDNATVKIDYIGTLIVDASGKINFKQDALPTPFLQPVFAERVIHPDAEHQILVGDKETTNTVMTGFFSETPEVKNRWWIWAIILGVIGLLTLIIYFTELHGTSSFGNAIKI